MEVIPEITQPKKKHVVATVVVVIIFILLGAFILRVLFLYNKMLQGDISNSSWIDFGTEMTTSDSIVTSISTGTEIYDVATEDDPSLGSHEAVLTIVQFADFSCPFCARASYSVRRLASEYGNQVQFIFRDFPVSDIHPQTQLAAEAGACAHEQGKFWAFHDKLYQNQDDFSYEALGTYAQQTGLDINEFATCLADERYRDEVLTDFQDGAAAGVVGTPTFFFNGTRVQGAIPDELFEMIVTAYLELPEQSL